VGLKHGRVRKRGRAGNGMPVSSRRSLRMGWGQSTNQCFGAHGPGEQANGGRGGGRVVGRKKTLLFARGPITALRPPTVPRSFSEGNRGPRLYGGDHRTGDGGRRRPFLAVLNQRGGKGVLKPGRQTRFRAPPHRNLVGLGLVFFPGYLGVPPHKKTKRAYVAGKRHAHFFALLPTRSFAKKGRPGGEHLASSFEGEEKRDYGIGT